MITSTQILIKKYNYHQVNEGKITGSARVYQVNNYTDYQKIYIKINNQRYYFITTNNIYHCGDQLELSGMIQKNASSHTPGGFNYQEYLKHQDVYGKITIDEIKVIGHYFSLGAFHEYASMYLYQNYDDYYNGMLAALLIGDKNRFDENLQTQINQIGISHLFVISGLHIEVISKALFIIFNKIKVKEKIKILLVLMILLFYYMLTNFMVSILRVLISFIFQYFLSQKMKSITRYDRFSFNVLLVLIINPYYLFSYSFLLSYIIVLGILLIQKKLKQEKGFKSFIYNNLMISSTSTLISLPLVIKINNEINFLSIIYNLFFIPLITYLVLPFSFLIVFVPFLKNVYYYIYYYFNYLTDVCAKIDFLTLVFPQSAKIVIILYYLCFFLLMFNWKRKTKIKLYFAYGVIILIWLVNPYLQMRNEIHFLSLPTGDATFICSKHQQVNVLIDTGDYDATELVNFLRRKGVKKIDAVIISHGDSDHIGGLISMINEFYIKKIYVGIYDQTSINYLKKLYYDKLYLVKAGDVIKIGNLLFDVLFPINDYRDINNNSLVIMARLFNLKILFTGDIERKAELDLINKYPSLSFDILKVAHHGSKTSSSDELLKKYRFKYAIAMNGYANQFNFPSSIIVERFKTIPTVKMYNTMEYGTITIVQSSITKKIKFTFSYQNN